MSKIAVSVAEAVEIAGFSRTRLYELFREGHIKPRKQGRRTLVLVDELKAYITSLPVAA